MNAQKISEAVKELRERLGLTQPQFAEKIGRSYPMVQRFENVVPPQGASLAKLCVLAHETGHMDLGSVFVEGLRESEDARTIGQAIELFSRQGVLKTGTGGVVSVMPGESRAQRDAREFGEWMAGQFLQRDSIKHSAEKQFLEVYISLWKESKSNAKSKK